MIVIVNLQREGRDFSVSSAPNKKWREQVLLISVWQEGWSTLWFLSLLLVATSSESQLWPSCYLCIDFGIKLQLGCILTVVLGNYMKRLEMFIKCGAYCRIRCRCTCDMTCLRKVVIFVRKKCSQKMYLTFVEKPWYFHQIKPEAECFMALRCVAVSEGWC